MLTPEERARIAEEEEQYHAEVRRRQAWATWKGALIALAIAVGIAVTIGVIIVEPLKTPTSRTIQRPNRMPAPAKQDEFADLAAGERALNKGDYAAALNEFLTLAK